jgi:pilus assembly protein CpaE
MTSQVKTPYYSAAVISVCLSDEIQKSFESAMGPLHWNITPAKFDTYISADRRASLPQAMKEADLRIAFVDFDWSPEQAAESTRYLKQIFQGAITVIAVGKPRDSDLLLLAMRAGCNEFLQKPVEETALLETMRRLEVTDTAAADLPRSQGEVLSFFGAKGGVGTTTIAVHLAMYLVQCQQKKVLLIDDHDALGHVCVYLGLDGAQFQFQDVVRSVSRLDSELLRGYVARHSSGLEVLASPDTCSEARGLDPAALAQTLDYLRGEYDFILVDSELSYDDACLGLLEVSSQAYLTVTPEIGPLRDLSRHLEALGSTDRLSEKVRVVLNRFPSPYSVTQEEIEAAIKRPITIKLPNAYLELLRTENLGQPLPPTSKSEFSAQIKRWSQALTGPAKPLSPTKGKRSFFNVLAYKPATEVHSS